MALHPRLEFHRAHLTGWVADAELELIRFTCNYCGGTTEPLTANRELPEDFKGVPHEPDCPLIDGRRAA